MVAISQVDTAGTTGLRGLSPTIAPAVLPSEEQDVFSQGANVGRANQRAGVTQPTPTGQAQPALFRTASRLTVPPMSIG